MKALTRAELPKAFWVSPKPVVYDRTPYVPVPIRGRKAYYSLRSQIRLVRRGGPHPDVDWFAVSLGLDSYSTDVTQYDVYGNTIYSIGLAAGGRNFRQWLDRVTCIQSQVS
jgi:hypothetical protein